MTIQVALFILLYCLHLLYKLDSTVTFRPFPPLMITGSFLLSIVGFQLLLLWLAFSTQQHIIASRVIEAHSVSTIRWWLKAFVVIKKKKTCPDKCVPVSVFYRV